MTQVDNLLCETCANSEGRWDRDEQHIQFWCLKSLMGDECCLSYEKGVEG